MANVVAIKYPKSIKLWHPRCGHILYSYRRSDLWRPCDRPGYELCGLCYGGLGTWMSSNRLLLHFLKSQFLWLWMNTVFSVFLLGSAP